MSKLIDATIRIRTKDGIVEYNLEHDGVGEIQWNCTEVTNSQHSSFIADGVKKLLEEEYP